MNYECGLWKLIFAALPDEHTIHYAANEPLEENDNTVVKGGQGETVLLPAMEQGSTEQDEMRLSKQI